MSKTSKRYGYRNNIATIIVIILALNLLSANGEIYILFKQVTLTLRVIYPDDVFLPMYTKSLENSTSVLAIPNPYAGTLNILIIVSETTN